MFKSENHDLVTVVLRFAAGAAFLWFGIDKWVHPEAWLSYVPDWVAHGAGGRLDLLLNFLGTFEFAVGIFLVAGSSLRTVSAAAGFYLALTSIILGASEVTVRDASLVGALLALFIEANMKSRKPLNARVVSHVCTAYVAFLFLFGVLFLRSGS